MSKHTPGPWNFEGNGSKRIKADGTYPDGIAHVMDIPGWNSYMEEHANAYLIAVAPEMLESLKEAVVQCCNVGLDMDEFPFMNKMRKAIAKTEGKL